MKRKKTKKNDFELVIGLTGLKAAGKDELARFLGEKLGFTVRSCGDEIRDQLKRDGFASPTFEQQVDLGNRGRRESGDIAYWAKRVLSSCLSSGCRRVVVNGLRHPDEILGLREMLGDAFIVVGIVAPLEIRARRLIDRGRPGDPGTFEAFMQLDDTDRGVGQPPHGQQVDRTLALVPWENVYNNRGTLDEYRDWIESFVRRVLKTKGAKRRT